MDAKRIEAAIEKCCRSWRVIIQPFWPSLQTQQVGIEAVAPCFERFGFGFAFQGLRSIRVCFNEQVCQCTDARLPFKIEAACKFSTSSEGTCAGNFCEGSFKGHAADEEFIPTSKDGNLLFVFSEGVYFGDLGRDAQFGFTMKWTTLVFY